MSECWSVRVAVQAPDGRIFNYAMEERSREDAAFAVQEAAEILADETEDPASFVSPDIARIEVRALFTYRHLGWGLSEPRQAAKLVAEDGA